jgi:hypothetical protein
MIAKPQKNKVTIESIVIENQELREALGDLYAACMAYGVNIPYLLSHPDNNGKLENILKYLKDENSNKRTKRRAAKTNRSKKNKLE